MQLTAHLPDERRSHVEGRLRGNLMAWLTTVRPDGRPDTVPVWFLLRDDGTILLYSQKGKRKLASLAANPQVSLCLDVTDIGRDVIRLDATAELAPDHAPADLVPEYVVKYRERIGAMFGTAHHFGEQFSEAVVLTPRRLYA